MYVCVRFDAPLMGIVHLTSILRHPSSSEAPAAELKSVNQTSWAGGAQLQSQGSGQMGAWGLGQGPGLQPPLKNYDMFAPPKELWWIRPK